MSQRSIFFCLFKVYFTEALELVRGRKVYISKGYAYVPHQDLVVIILSLYRSRLSQALAVSIFSTQITIFYEIFFSTRNYVG